jgi:F-type H+-transporting ATPase subunit epsilon
MPAVFSMTVMAPEQSVFQGNARSLMAPGKDGYFGVLARHASMVAELGIGKLSITDESGTTSLYAIAGGFLETGDNEVTVLADSCEPAQKIDLSRAEAAEQRARERLSGKASDDLDVARAQAALQRALNRLRVGGASRGA